MSGCDAVMSEDQIKAVLNNDGQLIAKYNKFSRNKRVLSNKDMKFCPIINCEGFASFSGSKFVECINGHVFCFNCLRPEHTGQSCEEIIDRDFEDWKKGKLIKQCPFCKFWTEKSDGCNHMTCRSCAFQWCWLCSGEYESGHYAQGTCLGLQFSKIFLTK